MTRARTAPLLQLEAAECGAVALAMVLGRHGRWEPPEALREACGVSRDGSTAAGLVAAAGRYGLTATAWRVDAAGLRRLSLPLIVHWQGDHFLVVEGFGRDRVHLNDPAFGHRTVGAEEFAAGYGGVALAFAPTEDFRPGGERPGRLGALRPRLLALAPALALSAVVGLGLVVPVLALPTVVRLQINEVMSGLSVGSLPSFQTVLAAAAAFTFLVLGGRAWFLQVMEERLAAATGQHFLARFLRLPMAFLDRRHGAELAARLALNERVARRLCADLGVGIGALTVIAAALGLTAWLDPLSAGVAVAGLLAATGARAAAALAHDAGVRRRLAEEARLAKLAGQGLEGLETIKVGSGEAGLFDRLTGLHARLLNGGTDGVVPGLVARMAPMLAALLAAAGILVTGGLAVMEGRLGEGGFAALLVLAFVLFAPRDGSNARLGGLDDLPAAVQRLDDVLRHPIDAPRTVPARPRRLRGGVELRGVSFGYAPGGLAILDGFDLAVPPGKRVALVGASGCGKSTVLRLVAGLYLPWSGEILVDGRPLAEHPSERLRRAMAVVDQRVVLFEGSIRDNLTLWDTSVPEERMVAAAVDAGIHRFIVGRAGGYDAPVAEHGGNFSGGQRAQLELARALALDPAILLLDETTATLDPLAEAEVIANLRRRGCTTLIAAHRLGTVRDCDEIVVLDRGRVVQRGRHAELVQADGPYRHLVNQ